MLDVVLAWSPEIGQMREQQVQLPAGATLAQAMALAGWAEGSPCGIWGRVCDPGTPLHAGDRVEQYRPLKVDPKVARRERFAQQGARGAGLFSKRRPNSKLGYGG